MDKRKLLVGAGLMALVLAGAGCDVASGRVKLPAAGREPAEQATSPQQPDQAETPLLGGDRDAHGCIGSAGYSWCEAKQKCLRVWEEKCL